MAGPENKPPQKSLLAAMAAGDRIPPAGSKPDPDFIHLHPAEDFAVAWLTYWRAIGNDRLDNGNGYALLCAELTGPDEVPQPDLPPHLRLWNNDMREGAQRAMQVMLAAVPGGRDALRNMVSGRGR